jgi:hypothetical protein
MSLPFVNDQVIQMMAGMVSKYIEDQRARYEPAAHPLAAGEIQHFAAYFPAPTLDRARLAPAVPRIKNPDFYLQLRVMGIKNLPSFEDVAAITFVDVIVHNQPLTPAITFHELVHVEQYRQMGLEEFSRRYLKGFLKGGSYEQIPLEKHARELEERYVADAGRPFSVESEVREAVAAGLV